MFALNPEDKINVLQAAHSIGIMVGNDSGKFRNIEIKTLGGLCSVLRLGACVLFNFNLNRKY